jgi:hypothetical protein
MMLNKLKCQFKYNIRYWHRDFIIGIKNLIRWFPIVWKDRQWDYQFIYSVLRHKLHLTEQFIRYNGVHVKNIQDADKIKKCVLLLDRLIKDKYHENIFDYHYKKWGSPEMIFSDVEDLSDYKSLNIEYPNVKTEKDRENQRKEFNLKIKSEEQMKDQDLDMLFKTMRKYIQTWWD